VFDHNYEYGSGVVNFTLISTHDICERRFGHGKCARRVTELVSVLMIQKTIFVMTLAPLWRISKVTWMSRMLSRLIRFLEPRRRFRSVRALHSVADQALRALLDVNLDNIGLTVIGMVELGIVFGAFSPILLPLVAVYIWFDLATLNWILLSGRGIMSSTSTPIPLSYTVVGVVMQSFFFMLAAFDLENGSMDYGSRVAVTVVAGICGVGGVVVSIYWRYLGRVRARFSKQTARFVT